MPVSKVSTFFDRYAHDFDAIYGNRNGPVNTVVNKLFRRSMALRYRMTIEGCNPIAGRTVLDIGCGPGHYAIALAKQGAGEVLGIDFADGMLEVARESAARQGVGKACRFEKRDFLDGTFDGKFDYVIAMGFMDYIADPSSMIRKALSMTNDRAFFSFPLRDGIMGWQRKMRYRSRCELYLYTEKQVLDLFSGLGCRKLHAEKIARDLFVEVDMKRS